MIDDETRVREVLGDVFLKQGFEIAEASDGHQGLACAKTFRPDLILCDLRMPVMGGLDFVRQARSEEPLKHLPILMLTSDDNERNEVALLEAGANDFMSKSASLRVILAHVRRALEK